MRILVTGANGILGTALQRELRRQGLPFFPCTRKEADLSREGELRRQVLADRPELVLHCASYTQVDRAETDRALCRRVNVEATRELVEGCEEIGAALCFISTDYVFDGRGTLPHPEGEIPAPLNFYGQTKYEAEQAVQRLARHYIVRTSWLYGDTGAHFLEAMLRLGSRQTTVPVVDDQIGAPTYAPELAAQLLWLVRTGRYGIYHSTGAGECSFAGYAEEIFAQAGLPVQVERVSTGEYVRRRQEEAQAQGRTAVIAERPRNSRLGQRELAAAGIEPLPDWKKSVNKALAVRGIG